MNAQDRRVVVVGAGGHAKVVIDVLRASHWEPVGLLDEDVRGEILGVPVLGSDALGKSLFADGFRNAIIAIGRNDLRRRLGKRMQDIGFSLISAVHPSAVLSPSASIGAGVVVMPQAVINAQATVDNSVIINTRAVVEHNCLIGEAAHIAPGSVMGGCVTIGEEVFFGIGAVARPLSRIGARTIVGAGAVVIGEIPADTIVVGVPARPLDRR